MVAVGHFVSPPDYKMAQGVSGGKMILVTNSTLKVKAASTLIGQRQTWLTCLWSTLAINRSRGEAELITELRHKVLLGPCNSFPLQLKETSSLV